MLVILGLALLAGFNPKLLIVDLILAGNKRPGLMFLCFLLGGIGLGLTVGLLDLFVLNIGATKTQNHTSGGLDLALGITLLAVGALLATDHLHIRRRRHHPPPKDKQPSKLSVWAQRSLHEPPVLALAVIGPTAGRWYIDVSSGVPPKQFIRGEWFGAIAALTGLVWVICDAAGLGAWWSAGISFAVGFTVRVLALYRGWEEPLAKEARRGLPALRRPAAAGPQDRR